MRILKEKLFLSGYTVDTLGLFDDDAADLKSSDMVVLPVPTTKDKKIVFAPITGRKIFLSDINKAVNDTTPILCCNYCFSGKNCIDYGKEDSYALLNAVPTAEGAIKLAIENTDFTLWQSKVLVIGYGRVGKILADRLKKLGCKVTVSARKQTDFAMLSALGFEYTHTNELILGNLPFDIVFNTVDFPVLREETFKRSDCTLAVDLSSLGGFSIEEAERAGVKAIFASGLPGKIAPKTAAKILFDTVNNIIIREKW